MDPISCLVSRLKENKLDAALVSDPNAIYYFTGTRFSPGERLLALVVKQDGSWKLCINILFPYEGAVPTLWYSDAQDGVQLLSEELTGTVAYTNDLFSLSGGYAETNGVNRWIVSPARFLVTGDPVTVIFTR